MYNDYQLADINSAKAMRQKFDEVIGLEVKDLKEIYDKLQSQKSQLVSSNSNAKLDNAISKINQSILELDRIIQSNNYKDFSQLNDFQKTAYSKGFSQTNNTSHIQIHTYDTEEIYGKIRSEEEMLSHSHTNTSPNQDNATTQIPNNTINNPLYNNELNSDIPIEETQPSNNTPNNNSQNNAIPPVTNGDRNPRKRNSLMQSSIISRLAKSIFVKKQKVNHYDDSSFNYRNKYHNVVIDSYECSSSNKLLTNQIDLIRMILLFIALRPNCKYMSRIARIANTQLEVMMDLIP